ncbi:hypothetical protein FBY31_3342 [Arthrobacter sp. SLBN-100]|nr:hypothetical protein FBY31_3342 [Arthrobacter sp. SLBN-100]
MGPGPRTPAAPTTLQASSGTPLYRGERGWVIPVEEAGDVVHSGPVSTLDSLPGAFQNVFRRQIPFPTGDCASAYITQDARVPQRFGTSQMFQMSVKFFCTTFEAARSGARRMWATARGFMRAPHQNTAGEWSRVWEAVRRTVRTEACSRIRTIKARFCEQAQECVAAQPEKMAQPRCVAQEVRRGYQVSRAPR